jgi:hypothetical protein
VSCACEVTLLFGFVLSGYKSVYILALRLLEVEHLTYGDKWDMTDELRDANVFERSYMISPQIYPELKDRNHAVNVRVLVVSRRQ